MATIKKVVAKKPLVKKQPGGSTTSSQGAQLKAKGKVMVKQPSFFQSIGKAIVDKYNKKEKLKYKKGAGSTPR